MLRRLLVLLAMAAVAEARACSVPVFRFALERWQPATFPVVVRGEMAEVRYPDTEDADPPLWSGLASRVDEVSRSPARTELVRLLVSGESAVWILLQSGDEKADRAAEMLLRTELARLATVFKLPPEKETANDLLSPLPLRLSFAIVKVRRDDPAEAVLVKQLLDLDDDLKAAKGPMAIPVFGRGRALCALVGDGLSEDEIASAAKFLCGACFCSVKRDCPGKDLLLDADWTRLLKLEDADETPKPAPVIAPGVKDEPTVKDEPEAVPSASMLPTWLGMAAAGGLALALAAWRLAR